LKLRYADLVPPVEPDARMLRQARLRCGVNETVPLMDALQRVRRNLALSSHVALCIMPPLCPVHV
jgi:hypothetical protein